MSTALQKLERQYRAQALASMSPKDRLILKIDLAWKAANAGEMNRLLQLLVLLRMSISFKKNPIIALNALRLYRHCEYVLNERQDFVEVAKIMFNLKRALTIAQDRPMTPEAVTLREQIRKAKDEGVLFFGKHGRHYGPRPRRRKAAPAPNPDAPTPPQSKTE